MTQKRTIVVTGGTTGIGLGIVKAFQQMGDHVLIGARKNLDKNYGHNTKISYCDVRKRGDHVGLVNSALEWTGRLDVYVNCAGVSIWKPLAEIDEEFWSLLNDTNAAGTFWGCQAAASVMKSGGCIINISSLAGKRGSSNNSAYCASKFAVNGMTQALAKELGPSDIRVNAICPVFVQTPMILETLTYSHSPAQGQKVDEFLKAFTSSNAALNRLPTAENVGALCVFLASEGASTVTGQCWNVDSGVLPQ